MSYTRSEIISGVFVIAAILLFVLFAFEVTPFDPTRAFRTATLTCETTLEDASGIAPGTPVLVAGHEVGEVKQVTLIRRTVGDEAASASASDEPIEPGTQRQAARVRFALTDETLRLDPDTATVRPARSGLLGRQFLALDPGRWRGERAPIAEAALQPPVAIRSHERPGMRETIARLQPVIGRVTSIARKIDQRVLAQRNMRHVSEFLRDMRVSIGRVRTLLGEGEGSLDQKLLAPLRTVLSDASNSIRQLRRRLMERTLPRAEKLMQDGSAFAKQARQVADRADTLVANNEPRVKRLIEQATATARRLEKDLARVADDAERLLEHGDAMLVENRAEIAETIRRGRRALWQAEMGLRKIRADPSLLFFGDDERLLGASPYDTGWMRRSGRAEPYEQRDEND